MRVAVIGGGPSGLVTLKYLKTAHQFFPMEQPINVKLFESEAEIGGAFKYQAHEESEVSSSRQLVTFSDYRYAPESSDFLSAAQYCHYLDGYVQHFGLTDSINLSTTVTNISRTIRGGHIIHCTRNGVSTTWACDAVAICCGSNASPNIPHIPGIEMVAKVLHSSEVKERSQFGDGKDILIIGCGDSAMETAYLAITSDKTRSVTIAHRNSFCYPPRMCLDIKDWFTEESPATNSQAHCPSCLQQIQETPSAKGLPFDVAVTALSPFTRTHQSLIEAQATQFVSEFVNRPNLEDAPNTTISFTRSTKVIPYMKDDPNKRQIRTVLIPTFLNNWRKDERLYRQISLVPYSSKMREDGILNYVLRTQNVDMVVLATGYNPNLPFLDPSYPLPQHAKVRSIWKKDEPTIGFIGFVRPSIGAVPPISEMQAQCWILNLLHRLPKISDEGENYNLIDPSRHVQCLVNHEFYTYQLARDMGSVPGLSDVQEMGCKVALCYALSANFNVKFRLVGPWKWNGARRVMAEEIWETITRRPLITGHLFLSALPLFLFVGGGINLLHYLCMFVELLWTPVRWLYCGMTYLKR